MGMSDDSAAGCLYKSKELTENLFDCAPDAIVLIDRVGAIVRVNNTSQKVFGYQKEELLRGNLKMLIAPSLQNSFAQFCEQFQHKSKESGIVSRLDLVGRHKNGTEFPVEISLAPIDGSAGVISMAVMRDASERKTQERTLEQLMYQREDYATTLTHDLKTPIRAANRAIRLLLEGDFGQISETQRDILETLFDSNESMHRLVCNILDAYRYDSGHKQLNLATSDVVQMVRDLLKVMKPLEQEQGITTTCNLPNYAVLVRCDIEEIRRVIQNLVDNAFKFTPRGGLIDVSLDATDHQMMIKVRDNGKGISDSEKPHLFQRFWQTSSSGRNYAGTGLGLYLSRKIVEAHNGKLWCDSKVGAGSTFVLVLALDGEASENQR
ncbi:MAG TPA: PAS domain-containing sensor histidine kinase [Oculatellaceae cyanobacterium]